MNPQPLTPEQIKDLLENAGYETRRYSGRGMMGKECLAFVTDDSPFEIVSMLIEYVDNPADLPDILRQIKSDSMGLSMVYYMPRIAYA